MSWGQIDIEVVRYFSGNHAFRVKPVTALSLMRHDHGNTHNQFTKMPILLVPVLILRNSRGMLLKNVPA